ncbi:MAG: cytochrome b N-terminal domain-containing protein [Bacteriovoracaceae bacterium]
MFKKLKDATVDIKNAIDTRLGVSKITNATLFRRVAKTSWYQGDGAAMLMLFGTQVFTGLFMALAYSNNPDNAYESVQAITNSLVLGWFVRALHYWSGGMMVVMVVIHLFRHLLLGGYKAPREATWLVGALMFFLVLTMSFTGYTLRWDERAVYAIRVILNMFYNVPWIGEELVLLVQGGQEIGGATLSRFFALHVLFIPVLLGLLIGYHLYLVVTLGVTSKIERKVDVKSADEQQELYHKAADSKKDGEWFYPDTAFNVNLMGFIIFMIAFGLALFVGAPELYPKANLTEASMPMEEWWFYWYSSIIALLPPSLAPVFVVGFPLFVFFFLMSLPFLDRRPRRGIEKRPGWAVLVTFLSIALLSLTALRMQSPWTGLPSQKLIPLPEGVELSQQARAGRKLFVSYGCNSCHAIAGYGPGVGPDLAKVEERLSREEVLRFILNPPKDIPMPSYEGRLTEEEVIRIMEFVHLAQTFPFKQEQTGAKESEE